MKNFLFDVDFWKMNSRINDYFVKGRTVLLALRSSTPSLTVRPKGAENSDQSLSAVGPVKANVAWMKETGSDIGPYLNIS